MDKKHIVKETRDFGRILNEQHYVSNKYMVIYFSTNNVNNYRFGLSVGKKIGNAVARNYYKRIFRNICDINKKLYSNNLDYIIIVRKACTLLDFSEIEEAFKKLIIKIEKERENEELKKI